MTATTSSIPPESLPTFLDASQAWEVARSNEQRRIYRHTSGAQVFVPLHAASDLATLIRVAATEIAAAEERPVDDVVVDLLWMQFDKLHARRQTQTSSLSFGAGIEMHQAMGDLILAGARAATEPRASYVGGRRPQVVDDYLDSVRMIPAERGSFVVRALLPLSWQTDQPQLDLVGPAAPDVRAVTTQIATAAQATVETARSVAAGAAISRWDSAVERGVSSNLCQALTALVGTNEEAGDTELRVTWTWSQPAEPIEPVSIPRGLAPVIEAGADYLRGAPDEHSLRITGLVTKLHREAASGPGEITVKGYVDGGDPSDRRLRCELDEGSYHRAIAAHEQGSTVTVSALVRRHPQRIEVVRVEDIRVVAET